MALYDSHRLSPRYLVPTRISLTSLNTCIWLSYSGFMESNESIAVAYWRITKLARLYRPADLLHRSLQYGYNLLFFFMWNCLVRYISLSFKRIVSWDFYLIMITWKNIFEILGQFSVERFIPQPTASYGVFSLHIYKV